MHPSDILDETMASWQRERPDLDLGTMGTTLRLNMVVAIGKQLLEATVADLGISLGEFDVLAALRRNGHDAAETVGRTGKIPGHHGAIGLECDCAAVGASIDGDHAAQAGGDV